MKREREFRRVIPRIALVLAAVVVVGAALLSRASEPGGIAVGYVPLPTHTPTPRMPRAFSLPGGVTDTSALVMVQGSVTRRLTIWSLGNGAPPVEIDRGLRSSLLLPNPAGTRVLYSAGSAVMVLDVPARRAQIVGELPEGGDLIAAQWSPNGQMIAYVVQLAGERVSYVAWQDASQPAREMMRAPRGLPLDVAWLGDGRPVTIFMGIGPVGGLEARPLMYNWMTDERVLLPADVKPLLQPYDPGRSPDGREQLFPMIDTSIRPVGGCPTGRIGLFGEAWLPVAQAGSGVPHDVAFEEKQVLLGRPTWLQSGDVLVRGMASAACGGSGSGLYLGAPGEPLRQLARAATTLDAYSADGAVSGLPYAVSLDERYVVWADADLAAQRSIVYRTRLDDGQTETLYRTPIRAADSPMEFKDREMVVDLVWLP